MGKLVGKLVKSVVKMIVKSVSEKVQSGTYEQDSGRVHKHLGSIHNLGLEYIIAKYPR